MKRIFVAPAWLTVLALAACGGESQLPDATGSGSVRVINAIKSSPSISFLIEERFISSIDYKNVSSGTEWDDLEYTFNFEVFLAGDAEATRVASRLLDVVRDTSYTFLLSGDLAAPTLTLWESPEPSFSDTATNFELQVAHTASGLVDFDVYFAAPGTAPALGQELGTLSFGEILPVLSLEAGDYVLTLTAVGDPTTVLFESDTIPLTAATSVILSTFDADANDLGPFAVRGFNLASGGSFTAVDVNITPTVRFYGTNIDIGAVDIYVDDPLTTPLVDDLMFRQITGDLAMPDGTIPLTVTAGDNMGSILFDTDLAPVPGTRNHIYVAKNQGGADSLVIHLPDRRSIETLGRVSILNAAAIDSNISVFVVTRGDTIDEAIPALFGLIVGREPAALNLTEGEYDIYITLATEATILAGPVPLDVVPGDVFEIVVYQTADPTVVDVVFIPSP